MPSLSAAALDFHPGAKTHTLRDAALTPPLLAQPPSEARGDESAFARALRRVFGVDALRRACAALRQRLCP